jgi:hypothetical protein
LLLVSTGHNATVIGGQWRNGDHNADVVVVTVAPGWIPCARYIDFNRTKE